MMDLDPHVKLDTILTIITNRPFGLEYEEIKVILNEMDDNLHRNLYISDLPLILQKLELDGFLTSQKVEMRDLATGEHLRWANRYKTTYDGKIFHLKNGYSQRFIDSSLEERRKKRSDRMLILGTWAAGIAGFLLFVMELIKYCFPRKT